MADASPSRATRFLRRRPDVRRAVTAREEFQRWREQFRTVVVDGVQYYVMGGDMLRDEDELILEWARRAGLVTTKELED